MIPSQPVCPGGIDSVDFEWSTQDWDPTLLHVRGIHLNRLLCNGIYSTQYPRRQLSQLTHTQLRDSAITVNSN